MNSPPPATPQSKDLGNSGELLVARYLESKGWTILARKFTVHGGEIDVVAFHPKSEVLAFVEVKVRTSERFGEGAEQLRAIQKKRIRHASMIYLRDVPHPKYSRIRYDFCVVECAGGKRPRLTYFRNV